MPLSEYIDQVQAGLQTFDDYGLSAQMDIAAETTLSVLKPLSDRLEDF